MAFMVGIFAIFVAFLAFIALWVVGLAAHRLDLREGATDLENGDMTVLVAAQMQTLGALSRRVAALEAELRDRGPADPDIEIIPPLRYGEADRAYRRAAVAPVRWRVRG